MLVAREISTLDRGWRFINKDVDGAQMIKCDDSAWQEVTVPHDWAISQPFDLNMDMQWVQVKEDGEAIPKLRTGRTGALPIFGVGWYRKNLPITAADNSKRICVEFDGAMSASKIYLNGKYIGECPYGYSSFAFDVTDQVNFNGGDNVLAVRLENKPESSRWYSGAGIYRNVRLVKTNPTHVAHWGTYVTTPEITAKKAVVSVKTKINNSTKDAKLTTTVFDASGREVATVTTSVTTGGESELEQRVTIQNPQLWSLENRNLYNAVSQVYVGKELVDRYETTFGVRTLRFDKDKGFFLNDKPIKMQGVCMHHDLGPLGAAVNHRAMQRQLEMLKEMGCNAIRTSHNPPDPYLLQLADEMGFLVQVEAFDEWKLGKNKNGYNTSFDKWADRDLRSMIRRDRNHPSVVMWSIGNEIREQEDKNGKQVAQFLVDICKSEDPTRPTTAGFDRPVPAMTNGLTDVVDLVGFNYKPFVYKSVHADHPNYVIYGSETASTVSTRGEYKFPAAEKKGAWYWDYQMSSYDLEYPNWASTPDTEFEAQDDNEFIFGEFVWTGFDYLGEPTPYNEGTPAKSSYFGIVDLAGLKKDRFYLYQSKWSDKPVLHLLPHWNWEDREGKNIPVMCYTNYPKAELFVNGKSMGVKEKNNLSKYDRYRLIWDNVTYQPGEIKVVAYDASGRAVAQQVIRTAGEPAKIRLTADRSQISADGKDLSFVTIEILDRDNNLCPRSGNMLFFQVSGAGELAAVCNGNPIDQTSFSSNYMRAFNGKMVAIVKSDLKGGDINLTVSGYQLGEQKATIAAK